MSKVIDVAGLTEELEMLNDTQIGIVMRALIEYAESGDIPERIKQLKTIKNNENNIVLVVFSILKNKVIKSKCGAKKGNKNACKNQAKSNVKKTIKNNENNIVLVVSDSEKDNFSKEEEKEKEKDQKKELKEEETTLVSKKVSKEKNLNLKNNCVRARERKSYSDVLTDFGVKNPGLREGLFKFIAHLQANGVVMINDRLENIIIALDREYDKDSDKILEINQAIVNGYKRLPCEAS